MIEINADAASTREAQQLVGSLMRHHAELLARDDLEARAAAVLTVSCRECDERFRAPATIIEIPSILDHAEAAGWTLDQQGFWRCPAHAVRVPK